MALDEPERVVVTGLLVKLRIVRPIECLPNEAVTQQVTGLFLIAELVDGLSQLSDLLVREDGLVTKLLRSFERGCTVVRPSPLQVGLPVDRLRNGPGPWS